MLETGELTEALDLEVASSSGSSLVFFPWM